MSKPHHLVALLGLSLVATVYSSGLAFAARPLHVYLVDKGNGNMTMVTSSDSVKAGHVTIDVTNKSTDTEHEFVIARLNVAPDKVPLDKSKDMVKESALTGVEEIGDIAPGKTGTMSVDLKAGKYLLFCNLPGHYEAGMHHLLKVTP